MTLKDASKREYSIRDNTATHEEIRTGCLQRIADANETMAMNYLSLIRERDLYKRLHIEVEKDTRFKARQIAALKGVITKLRKGGK
jgi:hypothetical protein